MFCISLNLSSIGMSLRQEPQIQACFSDDNPFSSFLKLPAKYVKELNQNVAILCLERERELSEDADEDSLFLSWNGAVSKLNPDAIEVPSYWKPSGFEEKDGGNDYFRVRLLSGVEEATTLELLPYSAEDWTLVSSQAGLIENMLLRQHSMARFGGCLTVQVSARYVILKRPACLPFSSCWGMSRQRVVYYKAIVLLYHPSHSLSNM